MFLRFLLVLGFDFLLFLFQNTCGVHGLCAGMASKSGGGNRKLPGQSSGRSSIPSSASGRPGSKVVKITEAPLSVVRPKLSTLSSIPSDSRSEGEDSMEGGVRVAVSAEVMAKDLLYAEKEVCLIALACVC